MTPNLTTAAQLALRLAEETPERQEALLLQLYTKLIAYALTQECSATEAIEFAERFIRLAIEQLKSNLLNRGRPC